MKKMLVVVDYQNDFVNGSLGFDGASSLEDGICEKIEAYLENDDFVIFTFDTHNDNYLDTREGKNLPVKHCIKGDVGHELYGNLKNFPPNENTMYLEKFSFGVSPKDICKIGEKFQNVDEIEIVGVVTDICVISNVVMFQSQYVNATVTVDASLCASHIPENHGKALDVMRSLQANVINY